MASSQGPRRDYWVGGGVGASRAQEGLRRRWTWEEASTRAHTTRTAPAPVPPRRQAAHLRRRRSGDVAPNRPATVTRDGVALGRSRDASGVRTTRVGAEGPAVGCREAADDDGARSSWPGPWTADPDPDPPAAADPSPARARTTDLGRRADPTLIRLSVPRTGDQISGHQGTSDRCGNFGTCDRCKGHQGMFD